MYTNKQARKWYGDVITTDNELFFSGVLFDFVGIAVGAATSAGAAAVGAFSGPGTGWLTWSRLAGKDRKISVLLQAVMMILLHERLFWLGIKNVESKEFLAPFHGRSSAATAKYRRVSCEEVEFMSSQQMIGKISSKRLFLSVTKGFFWFELVGTGNNEYDSRQAKQMAVMNAHVILPGNSTMVYLETPGFRDREMLLYFGYVQAYKLNYELTYKPNLT